MFINSVFSKKKMLIFQFIVIFSNFEYYASHPIFDKTSGWLFFKDNIFLPGGRGELFDWDYGYYKSATRQVKNAFVHIEDYQSFNEIQNDLFNRNQQAGNLDFFHYNHDRKTYDEYVTALYNRYIGDLGRKGSEVGNKIYPLVSPYNQMSQRVFRQDLFDRYKNMPDFGIGAMAGKVASDLFTLQFGGIKK